jgi:hypothetical protein
MSVNFSIGKTMVWKHLLRPLADRPRCCRASGPRLKGRLRSRRLMTSSATLLRRSFWPSRVPADEPWRPFRAASPGPRWQVYPRLVVRCRKGGCWRGAVLDALRILAGSARAGRAASHPPHRGRPAPAPSAASHSAVLASSSHPSATQGNPHRRARNTRRSRLLRPRTPHVRGHSRAPAGQSSHRSARAASTRTCSRNAARG